MDKIKQLQEIINNSKNIVVFTGAGISTGSGMKDFRSEDGIYNTTSKKYKFSPEYMLSSTCFHKYPEDFYDFYKKEMNSLKYKTNIAHKYLKKLEDKGNLKAIVTQNIDGLHTKAGNSKVYELHGTIYKNYCTECEKEYTAKYVFNSNNIPTCDCGGIIKPKVVLYEEALPIIEYNKALLAMKEADTLIVIGTSLTVYPACNMIKAFNGDNLVIINKEETSYDKVATLVIHDDLIKVFTELK